MRVKRYIAPSIHEAMERIRVDLGKDAVILNTKRIRTGGFLGLFKKEEFEVLAAIDPNKPKEVQESIPAQEERPLAAYKNGAPHVPFLEQREFVAVTEEATKVASKNEDIDVLKEVQEMRAMMSKLVDQKNVDKTFPSAFEGVVLRLRAQEVEEEVIQFLFDEVSKNINPNTIDAQQAERAIGQQMTKLLESRYTTPIHPATRLFHIIGPTGVGKTTTIAKLAANISLKQRKRIGLITTDTYRIAAIDQLRTYANILNAPLEVVYNATELEPAIAKLEENELIIMDTAGRNYRNKEYIEGLSHFLLTTIPSETYLVLSLTSKYSDNAAIIRQFTNIKVDKLIYTKLDETESYGSILNIAYHFPIPISFITNGQTVPDDFFVADPEQITQIILGGVHNGA